MTTSLNLGDGIRFPIDTVTDTNGILAIKGAGKTHTSMVLAEELAKHALPVVVFDVVGVTWGLRLGPTGKGEGLPFAIFGGKHADVPLSATAGKTLADVVVKHRPHMILDLSEFSKADSTRFITDFCTRLYATNTEPVHLIMDEADDYVPQRPFREEARCLRAVEVLVRRGRAKGIGVTLITQRAASINKGVLTQVSNMIIGRTISPQDRAAVQAWVDAHGTGEQKKAFWDSVPSLPTNEKWFWSPARDVFKRGVVRARETYDSSFTPKVGSKRLEPKALSKVDLKNIEAQLAETIEQAKADDPRELRARVKQLEAELAKKPAPIGKTVTKTEKEFVIDPKLVKRLEKIASDFGDEVKGIGMIADRVQEIADDIVGKLASADTAIFNAKQRAKGAGLGALLPAPSGKPVASPTANLRHAQRPSKAPHAGLDKASQALLNGIAARTRVGMITTDEQAALLAGYSPTSSSVPKGISRLNTSGFLTGTPSSRGVTTEGQAAAVPIPLPSTIEDAIHLSAPHLEKAPLAFLTSLAQGENVSVTEWSKRAGYSPDSSSVPKALSRLRTLGMIEGRGDGPYVFGRTIIGLVKYV